MVRNNGLQCCSCSLSDFQLHTAYVHNTNQGAEEYLGMPFGHAARFEPPVDFKGKYKTEVIETKYFGHACKLANHFAILCNHLHFFGWCLIGMQVGAVPSITYGSEDCLYANIWSIIICYLVHTFYLVA